MTNDKSPKHPVGWGATGAAFFLLVMWFYPEPFVTFSQQYPLWAGAGLLLITFLIFREWGKLKILERFKKRKTPQNMSFKDKSADHH